MFKCVASDFFMRVLRDMHHLLPRVFFLFLLCGIKACLMLAKACLRQYLAFISGLVSEFLHAETCTYQGCSLDIAK